MGRAFRRWPRPPRRTARLRLTALYGALFLACGAVLLVVTYILVERAIDPVNVYRVINLKMPSALSPFPKTGGASHPPANSAPSR